MKTIRLIPLLFLSLIFVGCGNADANFREGNVIIIERRQNSGEKQLHEARYSFRFFDKKGMVAADYIFELSDDFGEVNDRVIVSNKMLFAVPDINVEK